MTIKKTVAAIVLSVIATCTVVGAAVCFPASRTALARAAFGTYLWSKGFHLDRAGLTIGKEGLTAGDVTVTDGAGRLFFSAAKIEIEYGSPGRALGLSSIALDRPHLSIHRAPDGTYDIARLFGNQNGGSGASSTPLRLNVRISNGSIDVRNPTCPTVLGRTISIDRIEARSTIAQGATSSGRISARLRAGARVSHISLDFVENDVSRFARGRMQAPSLPIAALVNSIVASPAFVVEDGIADATLDAYALGWAPGSGAQWHAVGTAELRRGRLRVMPFEVPLRDVRGPVRIADGTLLFPALSATAAGVPIAANGTVALLPSPTLGLTARATGPLNRMRTWLAFSRSLPLHGSVTAHATVRGPASGPHADVALDAPRLRYGKVIVEALRADVFYHDGHVALRDSVVAYNHASIFGGGDLDLAATPLSGQFFVSGGAPTRTLPWLADLNVAGVTRFEGAFAGPIAQLSGSGFATSTGGSTSVRAAVSASPQLLAVTSMLADARGGGVLAAGELVRDSDTVSADLYAQDYLMQLNGRAVSLPGITSAPIGLPTVCAALDGFAALRGAKSAPAVGILLRANGVKVGGIRVGHVAIGAEGVAPRYHLERLAVRGDALRLDATGSAMLVQGDRKGTSSLAGTVRGRMAIDIRENRPHIARVSNAVRGRLDGGFIAAFDGGDGLADLRVSGDRASIAGVPIKNVDALVGVTHRAVTIYSATARVAGGEIGAQGTLPGTGPGDLRVVVPRADLASLRGVLPIDRGVVAGDARITGTAGRPIIVAAATLTNGAAVGHAVSGDAQVSYRGDTLRATSGRVVTGDNLIDVDGAITGLRSSRAPGDAALSIDATLPEGDLATLSSGFLPNSAPLRGTVSARVHVGGLLGAPALSGHVAAGAGTVRGVAFNDLGLSFSARAGAVDVRSGTVTFGSSRLNVAGAISGGSVQLLASSRRIDLNDFNAFFNGKDVLEGRGSIDLALSSTSRATTGNGNVHFRQAAIAQVPLGTIEARMSPVQNGMAASIRQDGILGSTTMTGLIAAPSSGALPHVDLRADLRRVDLAKVAPYVGAENAGIEGTANVRLRMTGKVGHLAGRADFSVANGRIRRNTLGEASGSIIADGQSIAVPSLRMAIEGATLEARGRLDRDGRVSAHAVANIRDLAAASRITAKPASVSGRAVAHLDASGTLSHLRLRGSVAANDGAMADVAFDRAAAGATYADGRITGAAGVAFGYGHGAMHLSGVLPVRLAPFGFGPNAKPVSLTVEANDVGLAFLDPLLGNRATLEGALNGRASVGGTVGRPTVSGSAQVRGASIRSRYDTVPISSLNADLAFQNDAIAVSGIRAAVGNGSLEIRGAAHIVPATAIRSAPSIQYYAHAVLRGADVNVPNYLNGSVDADLSLTKSGSVPYAAGTVAFSNTAVPFASILALASDGVGSQSVGAEAAGLPRLHAGHFVSYAGSIFGDSFYRLRPTPAAHPTELAILPPAVDLDVTVTAGKNVGVRGLVDVTGTGTVAVRGDTRAPKLDGTLTAVRGRAGFLNTTFDLRDGFIAFDPMDGFLPTVDTVATTSTDEADITVSMSGRVDHLHTDLQSDPVMSRDGILAALLRIPQINSALAASHGQQQSSLGMSPGSLVAGQITGKLLGALNVGLEQFLNVEEVDFAIDAFGRPQLQVRKQMGPRVYSIYRTTFDVPPAQAFGIDYLVRRSIEVELSQTQSTPGINRSFAPPATSLSVRVTFH